MRKQVQTLDALRIVADHGRAASRFAVYCGDVELRKGFHTWDAAMTFAESRLDATLAERQREEAQCAVEWQHAGN